MSRTVRLAAENDLPAMHAILAICGEDMHRNKGLSHWYPFRPFDYFKKEVAEARVYAIYENDFLVGTFYLTENPRAWYKREAWVNPDAKAVYLGGFGILPFMQGRGMGDERSR